VYFHNISFLRESLDNLNFREALQTLLSIAKHLNVFDNKTNYSLRKKVLRKGTIREKDNKIRKNNCQPISLKINVC